tara:strand:+ start:99 stop:3344 length:3246 start_codon:yes stop_codon:yes gene_type:complete
MKKISILLLFVSVSIADIPNLFINEFLASNASINLDPDLYSFCDWIEIYNSEDTVVNISGFYITDDLSNPFKFEFPDNSIIQPNSFFIVWADGEDYYPGNYVLDPENIDITITTCHLNFKLKKGGEEIGLFNSNGDVIDAITFDDQITDISYGRNLDGNSEWVFFSKPTPSNSNISIGYQDTIRALPPQLLPNGGFYNASQTIEITSENTSGTIRFTLDGSKPNINSDIYNSPIVIDSTTVIRAKVFGDSILPSLITTSTYFINETSDLPIISIAIDSIYLWDNEIGIYTLGTNGTYQHGDWGSHPSSGLANYFQDWERPVSIEFFNPDENLEFKINAGIKVHGGTSRTLPQKALTVHFRNKYGDESISYQMFPDKPIQRFETLMLRNAGSDWLSRDTGTMFRDGMMQSLAANRVDIDRQCYIPSILFINGVYWGIHNIRERTNAHFIETNYNIDIDNIDILVQKYGRVYASEGDLDQYNQLTNFIESNDISIAENFNYIKTQVDINELLNYQILQIYVANVDWPQNNYKLWKPQSGNGKWRWIIQDTDGGFGLVWNSIINNNLIWAFYEYPESGLNEYGVWAKSFLHSLLDNTDYVNEFIQRFSTHLNTIYKPKRVVQIIDSLRSNLELEMPRHLARWENSDPVVTKVDSMTEWEDNVEIMEEFAFDRPHIVRQNIIDYFGLNGTLQLTVAISDLDGGRIEIHDMNIQTFPDTGIYFQNIPIKLKAIPNNGYQFVNWQGISGANSDSSNISISISDDSTITAVFERINLAPVMGEIESQSMDEDQLFEIVVNGTDENEEDMLTYGALSSVDDVMVTVSNDTLSIVLTENWFGVAELMVYITDGELSDTTSFILTVNSVNDAPTVFDLIGPEDSTQIIITSADLMQEIDLVLSWEPSSDVDNDDLSYGFLLYNGSYGEDVLINTFLSETVLDMSYQSIADLLAFMGLTSISGDWAVLATDGLDTTLSSDVWNITLDASGVLSVDREVLPTVFTLHQNYPNPFNPNTQIRYDLPEDANVNITIYDIMGRSIRSLVNSNQTAGYRSIRWDGKNNLSEGVSAGMYIYMIQTGEFSQTKKMVLLK